MLVYLTQYVEGTRVVCTSVPLLISQNSQKHVTSVSLPVKHTIHQHSNRYEIEPNIRFIIQPTKNQKANTPKDGRFKERGMDLLDLFVCGSTILFCGFQYWEEGSEI